MSAPLLLLSLLVSAAEPTDLESAEFQNTAHTLPKGEVCLHPFLLPTSVGVTDRIELKSTLLSLFWSANIAMEVGILQGEETAVSVEAGTYSSWDRLTAGGYGKGYFSQAVGKNRVNAHLGANYDVTKGFPTTTSMLGLGFDLNAAPDTNFRLEAEIDPYTMATWGELSARGSFTWNRSWALFRLSLGLGVWVGEFDDLRYWIARMGMQPPAFYAFPYPTVAMWWKF